LRLITTARIAAAAATLAAAGAGVAALGSTPALAQTSATLTYSCAFPIIGAQSIDITINATAPASVAPNSQFNLTNVQTETVIPGSVTQELYLVEKSISGTVTEFDINTTDASPSTLNAAATPIPFGPLPITPGQPLTVTVPASPTTVGPFTAGSSGTATLAPGNITISTAILGTTYSILCTAPSPIPSDAVLSVPIVSNEIPLGTIGGIGLGGLVGAGLIWRQRRRHDRHAARLA